MAVDNTDNELLVLEIIHRFVVVLDRIFTNVCELDLIFEFQKVYTVLDEFLIAGELQETSNRAILDALQKQDDVARAEILEEVIGGSL